MQNLKPFNLDRALAGDPVVTRDGRKVLNIAYLPLASAGQKVVAVLEPIESGLNTFYENGRMYNNCDTLRDLFMASIEKEYYIITANNSLGKMCISSAYKVGLEDDDVESVLNAWNKSFTNVQKHKITRLE